VVKETSLVWPILTHTNYTEWTMLMKINYEAMKAWETINPGTTV
jgi:hypothetical protein